MQQEAKQELGFSPKLVRLPLKPLLLPFSRRTSWILSHLLYFPGVCLAAVLSLIYGRPLAFVLRPRTKGSHYVCSREISATTEPHVGGTGEEEERRQYVEISGYSFIGWGVIAVDDPMVISHEFMHVEGWLGRYTQNKLAFNAVPLMVAGIFITPLVGLGLLSLAFSLALVLTFSLMAFVKMFH